MSTKLLKRAIVLALSAWSAEVMAGGAATGGAATGTIIGIGIEAAAEATAAAVAAGVAASSSSGGGGNNDHTGTTGIRPDTVPFDVMGGVIPDADPSTFEWYTLDYEGDARVDYVFNPSTHAFYPAYADSQGHVYAYEYGYNNGQYSYAYDYIGTQVPVTNITAATINAVNAEITQMVSGGEFAGGTGAGEVGASSESAGDSDEDGDEYFRLAMAPHKLKSSARFVSDKFSFSTEKDRHERAQRDLEKIFNATNVYRKSSKNFTVWVSGVYSQGKTKKIYDAPAAREDHYGVIAGAHHYDRGTKQLIGVAIDFGLGKAKADIDHDIKVNSRSNQVAVYYSKGVAKDWKITAIGALMRVGADNNRPYYTVGGNKAIAKSRGKMYAPSAFAEVSHKYKPLATFHLRSSFGVNSVWINQKSYREKNAGIYNVTYGSAKKTEIALKFGLKGNILMPKEDNVYGIYPSIGYARYVKNAKMKTLVQVTTGESANLQTGSAGKDLFNVGIGAGFVNKPSFTKFQVGYSAAFQRLRKSHMFALKFEKEF